MSVNKEFINALQKWIRYDDLIKEKNEELNIIKHNKDIFEQSIIRYIQNNNLGDTKLTLNGCNIYLNKTTTSKSLSFKLIEESLIEYFKNENTVNKICSIIKNKKEEEKKDNYNLKRKLIKPKKIINMFDF